MPAFEVVFFDSGGTLYDEDPVRAHAVGDPSVPEHYAAAPRRAWHALLGLGVEVPFERLSAALVAGEDEGRTRAGDGFTDLTRLAIALRHCGIAPRPELVAYVADAFAGPRYLSWVAPGTREMLASLHDARVDLGVIANTHWTSFSMDRAFAGVGLLGFLRTRVYSGDVGVAKPDARIFRIAAERASVGARRVLFVGNDATTDGQGARNAGWPVALRDGPGVATFGPDCVYRTWDELLAYVGLPPLDRARRSG